MTKKFALIASVLVLGAAALGIFLFTQPAEAPAPPEMNNSQQQDTKQEPEIEPPEEKEEVLRRYDITTPSSTTVIVNKNRPLPAGYKPEKLIVPDVRLRLAASHEQMQFREDAADELKKMFDAAAKDGVTLVFGSGYRSYELQKQFYDSYVAQYGEEEAQTFSAPPGTSEHQTGLSFDATHPDGTCHLDICFETTPQGQWLKENAHTYGFHLRYRKDKQHITTYQYEPWHFRFTGQELATELHQKDLTLEEYFNL